MCACKYMIIISICKELEIKEIQAFVTSHINKIIF